MIDEGGSELPDKNSKMSLKNRGASPPESTSKLTVTVVEGSCGRMTCSVIAPDPLDCALPMLFNRSALNLLNNG